MPGAGTAYAVSAPLIIAGRFREALCIVVFGVGPVDIAGRFHEALCIVVFGVGPVDIIERFRDALYIVIFDTGTCAYGCDPSEESFSGEEPAVRKISITNNLPLLSDTRAVFPSGTSLLMP